jgi:hypothetical protein
MSLLKALNLQILKLKKVKKHVENWKGLND